jgi:hypothetical protein
VVCGRLNAVGSGVIGLDAVGLEGRCAPPDRPERLSLGALDLGRVGAPAALEV